MSKIAVQAEQLGTGHAVMMADEYMGLEDTIMVLCGDTPLIEAQTLERFLSSMMRVDMQCLY